MSCVKWVSVVVFLVFLCAVMPVWAAPQPSAVVTQVEYLRWLALLRPEGAPAAGATQSEYVRWAQQMRVEPPGGWKLDSALSREAFAQTLSQLLGLNKSGNGNAQSYIRALEKEGIFVPEGETITRAVLVSVVDGVLFQSPSAQQANNPGSPTHGNNGVGNGQDPQPPGNPPINDGPGTGPGSPGQRRP